MHRPAGVDSGAVNTQWLPLPAHWSLGPDEVHVVQVPLQAEDAGYQALAALLSADEAQRAQRFVFDVHRRRFTVARGMLRSFLARLLHVSPAALHFHAGAHGKPSLPDFPRLQLNVSHSGDVALYAFAWERPVGVDVECLREVEFLALAKHSFSTYEQECLRELPASQLPEAFFACWSRKEAFIKAVGEGLSFPLRDFDVEPRADHPARLLANRRDHDEAQWSMHDVPPIPGASAALCVRGAPRTLRTFHTLATP